AFQYITQHQALELIQEVESKTKEYKSLLVHTKKRKKQLNDEIIEIYDTRRHLSELQKNSDLLDQIHKYVEFGAADKKKRKTVIKVCTIKHLRDALQEKYNIYITQQTLSTYLLSRYANTHNVLYYHYSANIKISTGSKSKIKSYIDKYYYLTSVKAVKMFTSTFTNYSLIIFQDDKTKVGLDILAVGRTFRSLQSFNKPVTVSDHDFSHGAKQKLIPSVYLIINSDDTNKSLCQAYNPVEHSIYILSKKLAKIELPIDRFGSHLNSQGVTVDKELTRHNFEFAEPYLTVEEVIILLNHLDTQQFELSNAAFLENFSNLSSIGLSHKLKTSCLLEAVSDVE
ncbi:9538_t:CDS:2, partial [Cetraspora pellucida]